MELDDEIFSNKSLLVSPNITDKMEQQIPTYFRLLKNHTIFRIHNGEKQQVMEEEMPK